MNHGITTVVYPVKALDQARALYRRLLGTDPYTDSPYYVGWKVGDIDIGLDPNGHLSGLTSAVSYYQVDDIKADLQMLLDAGAQLLQDTKDVGGGRLLATVKDFDGNIIGLLQDTAT